jgi:transcriptional repressor NrdR
MRCPYCGHDDLKVVDSRDSETGEAVRRRRECLGCTRRFTTYERIEYLPLFVIKKDGRREEFDRQKILRGLQRACEKRDVSPETLIEVTDAIEAELRNSGRTEIPAGEVGELVVSRLRNLDPIAYVRFASVYREFVDVEDFERAIREVRAAAPPGQESLFGDEDLARAVKEVRVGGARR